VDLQEKKCPNCGKTFTPMREHALYCSRTCADYVRQNRRRAILKKKYGTVHGPKKQ
jgi:uncharacterized OB-fold protein